QTHTSPINTLFSSMVLSPFSVILKGPPAAGVWMVSAQFAFLVAYVESTLLFHEVVITIFSWGPAQPHSLTLDCCCRTMLLLMIFGNLISAFNTAGKTNS